MLRQPEINQILFDSAREALRQGPEGALWDFIAYAHPWGFEPQGIRCRVQLWHGAADALLPPAHRRYFATELPNVAADFVPGEGHFSLPIKHSDLILRPLASAVPKAKRRQETGLDPYVSHLMISRRPLPKIR